MPSYKNKKAEGYEQAQDKWTLNKKASDRRIGTTIGGNLMSGKKGMARYSEEIKNSILPLFS